MAGPGVVLGAEQVKLGLRDIHLGKADIHRRPEGALGKRSHLAKRQTAEIECRLSDFEDRIRCKRLVVRLLYVDQDLGADVGDVLVLRRVAQLCALLKARCAAEVGQEFTRNHARRGAAVDTRGGNETRRECRTMLRAYTGYVAGQCWIVGRANLTDNRSARFGCQRCRGDPRVVLQRGLLSLRQGYYGWSLCPRSGAHDATSNECTDERLPTRHRAFPTAALRMTVS